MLDFAIFAVTFVIILIGAVLYLYPVNNFIILPDQYCKLLRNFSLL